ncbi:MAG: hypothetical protein R6V62_10945 [Candidatus Fermentibacteraceae bacterium]
MRILMLFFAALMLVVSCGTQTTMSLEDMRLRLDGNRCRAVQDKALYELMSWEYRNELRVTTDELLRSALPDSLLVCPVTAERYIFDGLSEERTLTCPSGHGSVELMEE